MTLWSISLIVPLVLIIMGAVPARWLNLQPLMQCRWATRIALLPVISTGVLCYLVATEGEGYVQLASFGGLVWSATVDGLSLIMLWLISLLGLVVARFSVNYLDGESCQGEFSRGLLLTLGSVLWLVVSANLLMLWIAWVLTSLGIQRLLLLHPGRRRAVLAGRQKFIISRLSEASLFIAVVMCNHLYGTLEIPQLLSWVPESPDAARSGLIWVALPLALAAMIRSVQFPCHTWLPETMETPTPVSALMHAGVVNAGGYLLIRLAPLMAREPRVLILLSTVGATTALFAALIMQTQTSLKRALAYSTISQMGFMILECGLTAYIAALLHLVAHSLYKAHAFLSSGNVLAQPQCGAPSVRWRGLLLRAVVPTLMAYGLVTVGMRWQHSEHSVGHPLILDVVRVLGVLHLLLFTPHTSQIRDMLTASCLAASIFVAHDWGCWLVFQPLSCSRWFIIPLSSEPSGLLQMCLIVGFVSVWGLQLGVLHHSSSPPMQALYVHASQGFYLDLIARKLVDGHWGRRVGSYHELVSESET